jgi:GNAT superfamily N-acetyltransferase
MAVGLLMAVGKHSAYVTGKYRMQAFSSADHVLAARVEAAEAANLLAIAQRAQATIKDIAFEPAAGGLAVFAGVGSPMTHAVGIGMQGTVAETQLEAIEDFFRVRGSPCLIDLCTLADPSVIAFVQSRPYRVVEFNNVLARRLQRDEQFDNTPGVHPIGPEELTKWSRVVSEGFSEYMPPTEEMVSLLASACMGGECWLAGDDTVVGGAAMMVQQNIALLTGDAVLVPARRQGWHGRLIRARLQAAQRLGCEIAATVVLPGSASHRNYERAGFELIYVRVNIGRDWNT